MLQSHSVLLGALNILTWAITAALTVFAILDATSLTLSRVSCRGLAVAAAALSTISLLCLGLLSSQYVWRRNAAVRHTHKARRVIVWCCTSFPIAALFVLLISLVIMQINHEDISRAASRAAVKDRTSQLEVQFALWVLAIVCQLTLFLVYFKRNPIKDQPAPTAIPRDSVISEIRESTLPTSLTVLAPSYAAKSSLGALPSPTFSTTSSQSLKSWRESLHQVVRPVTSRTKLIGRPSLSRDSRSIHSDTQSMDYATQADGFDTWDTSHVESQVRDTVMFSVPSKGTMLEPIPGSRPASPARVLDGPFCLPSSGRVSPALSLPPRINPDSSRPPSPALSEAHIHPLFRTESSTPPPTATPGTNITASPLSGQIITCPPRPYSRMRSNSRTASPSPLVHSESFQGPLRISRGSSSRSPSPPSREMTPPIPDFVLTSSPRSSLSGCHSKKRTQLQTDVSR